MDSGGKTYYISHQMAVNPTSKTTPVRVVYNSSQKFRGQSLNTYWCKGPDMLNSLHGVLLRFREDYVGAQGAIGAEILYGEPLGANLSTEYLRFHPGYLQIPYLTIHAAICRYHHNSAISWHRELKFCVVNP